MSIATTINMVTLLNNVSAVGAGAGFSVNGEARDLALFIIGSAGVSAGRVQIEEAHDAGYSGDWPKLGPPIDVPASGVRVYRPTSGAFLAVRATVIDAIVGGTVTVKILGVKEP